MRTFSRRRSGVIIAIIITVTAPIVFGAETHPPTVAQADPFTEEKDGRISLSDEQAEWIGNKIFRNECGGKDRCLITWNEGEDFVSLGIGHCIWYPEGKIGPFKETFPALLRFIVAHGKALPAWLQVNGEPRCPWQSRKDLLDEGESERVCELRNFLTETKGFQLLFIVERLNLALPKMLEAAPESLKPHIKEQFRRMAASPAGVYALADYVNFRGEGLLATERYNGQGWGLLQVLERMQGTDAGRCAVEEFARTAEEVLAERVKNSPPERNEKRWLPGWKKRLGTYSRAAAELERRGER